MIYPVMLEVGVMELSPHRVQGSAQKLVTFTITMYYLELCLRGLLVILKYAKVLCLHAESDIKLGTICGNTF